MGFALRGAVFRPLSLILPDGRARPVLAIDRDHGAAGACRAARGEHRVISLALARFGARARGPERERPGQHLDGEHRLLPPDGNTGALVSDRVNPLVFYGRAGSNVFVSRDGGKSFSQAGSFGGGGNNGGGGARPRAMYGLEGNLWVTTNGALWRSTDSAASFERINAVSAAQSLGFGQPAPGATHPALFLAGTVNGRAGLYRSDDVGASWLAIDDAEHRFGFINHLTGDPRQFGRVYLGTGGRGIVTGEPR
ncbi:MAG: hypothetical protein ABI895_24165 [Deltaproteobacteria bacterium]